MRTISVEALTHEAFAPFGQFYPMEQPEGYAPCGELHRFFPDRLNADSTHRLTKPQLFSANTTCFIKKSFKLRRHRAKIYRRTKNNKICLRNFVKNLFQLCADVAFFIAGV